MGGPILEPVAAQDDSIMAAGNAALADFDPVIALRHYDAVLDRDGTNVIAAAGRVRALCMLHDPAAGVELAALVDRAPDVVEVQVARGMVALGMRDDPAILGLTSGSHDQDLDLAQAAFDQVRRLAPGSVEGVRGQATVLRLRGRQREAIALLDAAVTGTADAVPLLVERSRCHLDLWSTDQALDDLREAVRLRPDDLEAGRALCIALTEIGTTSSDVWPTFYEMVRHHPQSSPEIDEKAGWLAYEDQDQYAEPSRRAECRKAARAAFEAVVDAAPGHVGGITGLAWVDTYDTGSASATQRLERALAENPRSPQLNTSLGWLQLDTAPERSLHAYAAARDQAPYLATAWEGLVAAALAVGRPEEAAQYLAEMQARLPGHPRTVRSEALMALRTERYEAALAVADRAVALDPSAENQIIRADALLGLGFHDEASDPDDPLSTMIRKRPGHLWLRWRRALRSEADGRRGEAHEEFATIAELDPYDTGAKQKRKELREWLRWHPFSRLGWRTVEQKARERAAIPDAERAALNEVIPARDRVEAARQLRMHRMREARLQAAIEWWDFVAAVTIAAISILLVIAPLVLSRFGAEGHAVFWRLGVAAVMLALNLGVWALALSSRVDERLLVAFSLVPIGVGLWVVVNADWPDLLRLTVGWLVVSVLAQILLVAGYLGLTLLPPRRADPASAHGMLLRQLIALEAALDRVASRRSEDRGEVADLIESIAQAQNRTLAEAGRRVARGRDPRATRFVTHQAAGVAAATRDLKRILLNWRDSTPEEIRTWARRTLLAAAAGEWGQFAWREPDPLPTRLRSWLRRTAVAAALATAFAGGVYLFVQMGSAEADSGSATIASGAGLLIAGGPVLVALLELFRVLTERSSRKDGEPAAGRPPAGR